MTTLDERLDLVPVTVPPSWVWPHVSEIPFIAWMVLSSPREAYRQFRYGQELGLLALTTLLFLAFTGAVAAGRGGTLAVQVEILMLAPFVPAIFAAFALLVLLHTNARILGGRASLAALLGATGWTAVAVLLIVGLPLDVATGVLLSDVQRADWIGPAREGLLAIFALYTVFGVRIVYRLPWTRYALALAMLGVYAVFIYVTLRELSRMGY